MMSFLARQRFRGIEWRPSRRRRGWRSDSQSEWNDHWRYIDFNGSCSSALLTNSDSSPIRYASSSSPGRIRNAQGSDIRSSSSALFVRGATDTAARNRRSDIHSDVLGLGLSSASRRRRLFVDQNGMTVHDASDAATFSNLNPDTSDADVLGGNSSRLIWGTNVSLVDSMNALEKYTI